MTATAFIGIFRTYEKEYREDIGCPIVIDHGNISDGPEQAE